MTKYQCEEILNAFPGFFGEKMAVDYLLHMAQACSWEAKPKDVDRYRLQIDKETFNKKEYVYTTYLKVRVFSGGSSVEIVMLDP